MKRVLAKYAQFRAAFPSFAGLAQAQLPEVLKVWQGMGYNRRGKYLQEAAKIIMQKYCGELPNDTQLLDELPGVGKATAASISAFAYEKPVVFIETNIRRVYLLHFFPDIHDVADSEILPVVASTLDKTNPREWYWALMDYGSYLATVVDNPNVRSKHYVKQSKFEGSTRQVRGKLLRLYLSNKIVIFATKQEQQIWQELLKEGLVQKFS